VAEGYAAGYAPDAKLSALVIEQLCKQGLQARPGPNTSRFLRTTPPFVPWARYKAPRRTPAAACAAPT
jgi:hypothetical protein